MRGARSNGLRVSLITHRLRVSTTRNGGSHANDGPTGDLAGDRTRIRQRARPGLAAYALLLPSAVFLVAFTYWPVVQVIRGSLLVRGFRGAAHWGFDNYRRLFGDPHFSTAVINNIVYAAGTIVPSMVLALLFAVALKESTRLTGVLRTLVALPMLIPLVAAASLFAFVFLPNAGLLDYYLAKIGVAETNWLGNPSLALGSIIAITVWKNCGYYMLFFLAGLAGIPQDLLDAAKIDGAGPLQRFRASPCRCWVRRWRSCW